MEKKEKFVYIGLFAAHDQDSKKKVKEYVLDCLKEIYEQNKYPEIEQDIKDFDKQFHYPKDTLHITNLFIGNKPVDKLSEKDKQIYKAFPFQQKHDIEIEAMLYVPGYLICGVAKSPIPCSNEYPHVTLFLSKDAKAVESNDVCTKFFKLQPEMQKTGAYKTMAVENEDGPKRFLILYMCARKLKLEGICRGQ